MTEAKAVPIKDLILVPSIITLAVTLLRLVGELRDWSPALFGKQAGGGGTLVGISWLIPVFGFYFGWRLARMGHAAANAGKLVGFSILAVAVLIGIGVGAQAVKLNPIVTLFVFCLASLAALAFVFPVWPAFSRTAVAYALAARIPVAIVMLAAILGNWGTHYDVAPPDAPQVDAMAPLVKWLLIGLLPQMTIWIFTTVAGGAVFAGIASLIAGRSRAS
ncbi:MAG TPA: hypothetical protein VFM88_10485 [Vicinamibacteria bacterium]|nr:hypothetical protein [Vicinamibacteria bacterium]